MSEQGTAGTAAAAAATGATQDSAATGTAPATGIDQAKYEKAVERAQRFEGMTRDLEKQIADLKTQIGGVDVEEYRALKAERERLLEEQAKNNPEEREKLYANREAKLRKEFGDEIGSLKAQKEKLEAELKTERVTKTAMGRIGPRVLPEFHRFLLGDIERFMDFHDGEIVVKDDKGVIRYSRVNPGEYMTPEEWADELEKTAPRMFAATAAGGTRSGSGTSSATPAVKGGQSAPPPDFGTWPKEKQTEFFRANPEALKHFNNNFSPRI